VYASSPSSASSSSQVNISTSQSFSYMARPPLGVVAGGGSWRPSPSPLPGLCPAPRFAPPLPKGITSGEDRPQSVSGLRPDRVAPEADGTGNQASTPLVRGWMDEKWRNGNASGGAGFGMATFLAWPVRFVVGNLAPQTGVSALTLPGQCCRVSSAPPGGSGMCSAPSSLMAGLLCRVAAAPCGCIRSRGRVPRLPSCAARPGPLGGGVAFPPLRARGNPEGFGDTYPTGGEAEAKRCPRPADGRQYVFPAGGRWHVPGEPAGAPTSWHTWSSAMRLR
jgi:hypothetical protein